MKTLKLLVLLALLALVIAAAAPIYHNWATTEANPFAVRGIHQTGATTNGLTMVVTLVDPTGGGASVVDAVFGPLWNADTTNAPSRNSVYDWGHVMDTDDDGKVNVADLTAGLVKSDAGGVLSLAVAGTDYLDTAAISDAAFAPSWNGVTTIAPSMNAVYDWGHIFDTDDDGKVNVVDLGAGLVKSDAGGVLATAVANTDYQAADSDLTQIASISGVNGDILYYNSGWQRLPIGTDGEVLELAAGLPSWETDDTGAAASIYATNFLYIPAGSFMPTAADGAATGTLAPSGTDSSSWDVYDFDDTTSEKAQVTFALQNWICTPVRARVYWTSSSASSSSVVWEVALGSYADDDTLGQVLGTGVNITDAWAGTANKLRISDGSTDITVGNTPVLNDLLVLQVARLPADGSDAVVGDARLLGLMLRYVSTNSPAW